MQRKKKILQTTEAYKVFYPPSVISSGPLAQQLED